MTKKMMALLALPFLWTVLPAQQLDTARIGQVVRQAVKLVDRNLPQEAIRSWDEAISLRPDFAPYKYERAICLVMLKQYKQAAEALQPIYRLSELFDRGYQLIGNCYDFMDDTAKARGYYREGLVAWPKSGRLHYELGNSAYANGDQRGAFDYWIKGTMVEPAFATNYYQVCITFANTPYRFWAILYGELFLNLERATQRTAEISQLLFKTWSASINPGTADPINLASEDLLNEPNSSDASSMNFPMAFEYTTATSVVAAHIKGPLSALSIEQVVEIRTKFIEAWKAAGYLQKYPNDLLSFHAALLDSGWINEYLWWLSSYGNTDDMKKYYKENEQRYDTFLGWFGEHSISFEKQLCVGYHCP